MACDCVLTVSLWALPGLPRGPLVENDMIARMRKKWQKFRLPIVMAVSALCLPILTATGVLIYQDFRDREFWETLPVGDPYNTADALLAFSQIVELVFFTAGAAIISLVLIIVALVITSRRRRLVDLP